MQIRTFLSDWSPIFLPCACVVLLPVGRMVEVPVLLMAAGGLTLGLRHAADWLRAPPMRTFLLVFCAYWIPILLSWPDAVNRDHTTVVAVNSLRFLLSGVFIVHVLSQPRRLSGLHRVIAWVLLFWVVDGVIQSFVGTDLFGYEIGRVGLNAVFGGAISKYGIAVTILAPLLWEHARRHWPAPVFWLVVAATIHVILSGGTRSTWIMLLVIGAAYFARLWILQRRFPLKASLIGLVGAIGICWFSYVTVPTMAARVQSVITMLTTDMGPIAMSSATASGSGAARST